MLLAFVFDSVGAGEWLVLLAVLLIVIGPKNLPSTLRKLGNHYAKFRRAADSFKRQLLDMDREFEQAANRAISDVKREVDDVKGDVEKLTAPTTDAEKDAMPPEAAEYGHQFD